MATAAIARALYLRQSTTISLLLFTICSKKKIYFNDNVKQINYECFVIKFIK